MLNALEPEALAELEHTLAVKLSGTPTAAARRVCELGALATLLAEQPPPLMDGKVPTVAIEAYEIYREKHAPDAPDHRRLVERYGSWLRACRAAYLLLPDGRFRGPGHPWASPSRGRTRVSKYTVDELHEGIRLCGRSLGRAPSSGDFHRWGREKRRLARLAGTQREGGGGAKQPRVPSISVLYRFYPRGANRWRLALADSGLTEGDTAVGRARLLLGGRGAKPSSTGPVAQLALAPEVIASCGFTAEDVEQIQNEGFAWLDLGRAAAVAAGLGGSLEWLAGRSLHSGRPPALPASLNRPEYERLRKERRLTVKTVREALDLTQSPYAALVRGKREPQLVELMVIATLLRMTVDELST